MEWKRFFLVCNLILSAIGPGGVFHLSKVPSGCFSQVPSLFYCLSKAKSDTVSGGIGADAVLQLWTDNLTACLGAV